MSSRDKFLPTRGAEGNTSKTRLILAISKLIIGRLEVARLMIGCQ